jgi:glycosyltransferase involved in cell wall biosynthesis
MSPAPDYDLDQMDSPLLKDMRVAFVFDHWYTPGGGQNEVLALMEMFPDAPLYTLMRAKGAEWDAARPMHVSFLDRMPFAHSRPNLYLPLIPAAIESFDFRDYDLVISFSASWSKGILTPPHTRHLCRSFLPMRYGWEAYHDLMAADLWNECSCWLAKKLRGHVMSYLRVWDVTSANRVDHFVANSHYVAGIIRRRYRREAAVVYPLVETEFFVPGSAAPGDYYLLVSRLTPYKRVELAVEAFNRLGLRLVVVGDGPCRRALQLGAGPNIHFRRKVDAATLLSLYQRCRGFIMPQVEDFGIATAEAMACGRPVIAYAAGGALESVIDGETGLLFGAQEAESLCAAVRELDGHTWDANVIRRNAERFHQDRFRQGMLAAIADTLHGAQTLPPEKPAAGVR